MLHLLFLKKINLIKLINLVKVYTSYFISNILKRNIYWGQPVSISVETNNLCNLKCIECYCGQDKITRPSGYIDFELYRKIVDESAQKLLNLFLYFQGEPFMHRQIFEFIAYAHKKNVFVTTSSNGHFFTDENARKTVLSGLDKLIISLDGTTQNVYEIYRKNGNIEKVIAGIKNIVRLKKELKSQKPYIVLQFLVLVINEHQITEIKHLAKELKVDKLELKSVQIYDFEQNIGLLPSNQKYNRYKKTTEGYIIKSKLRNKCWRLWNSTVITWDGNILPCCYDKDAKYIFGNVKSSNISDILNNKNSKNFRIKILKSRKTIPICNNCTNF